MKIAYISNSVIPSRTANSVHVMKMCQAFVKNGHQVTLLARKDEDISTKETDFTYYGVAPCFEIIKYNPPRVRWLGRFVEMMCALRTLLTRPRPDLLYARNVYNLIAVAHLRISMILEVHDLPKGVEAKITRWLFRQHYFVRLVAISEALCHEYLTIFPEISPSKVMVAHDGADVTTFDANERLSGQWPGRVGAMQIGYTGHLYKGRGIEIILTLASAFPNADFHIVGGTEEDIKYWKSFNTQSNVIFHGFVPPRDVAHYCSRFDVLLAPYQERLATAAGRDTARWMSPLKIFEYMSMGKAIICSDLPVLREILTDQINALLVKPSDIEFWSQALTTLQKVPVLRKRLGDAAMRDFLTNYTWQQRAANVLSGVDHNHSQRV